MAKSDWTEPGSGKIVSADPSDARDQRDAKIRFAREWGYSVADLAREFELSEGRIRGILNPPFKRRKK